MRVISSAEANRQFSQLLSDVRRGESFVITSHGKPLARIVPCDTAEREERERAKQRLLAHLDEQDVIDIGPWSRDELYKR